MGLDNPIHIAFLLIVLLLVFGAKRLPEMGRSLGGGMRGFRDALSSHDATALPAGLQAQATPVAPMPDATVVAPESAGAATESTSAAASAGTMTQRDAQAA